MFLGSRGAGKYIGPRQQEARDLWQRLGGEKSGQLTVAQIVKNARPLEKLFPSLIEQFQDIAVKGTVSWEAFRTLYDPPPSQTPSFKPRAPGAPPTEDHLRRIFSLIDTDDSGEIQLDEVIRSQELIENDLPELITRWSEIDVDDSGTISWPEFRAFFGGVDMWLEFQLGEIVGMEPLKEQIRRFQRGILLNKMRTARGIRIDDEHRFHMIFQGNPGTGKTTVARLMARLLHKMGILKTNVLTEVQREELVAGYVGQTARKTTRVLQAAAGGLLFVDEAYRLLDEDDQGARFGLEAIEELMRTMSEPLDRAPVIILAGYTQEMEDFMAVNSLLYRCVPYVFTFTDYSCAELGEMLHITCEKRGYKMDEELLKDGRQLLASVIEKKTLPTTRSLMNGGLCERIFSLAKQALDARDEPLRPTIVLSHHDVMSACELVPPPPTRPGRAMELQLSETDILREQMKSVHLEIEKLRLDKAGLQKDWTDALQPESPPTADVWTRYMTKEEEAEIKKESAKIRKEIEHLREQARDREERLAASEAESLALRLEGSVEGAKMSVEEQLELLRQENKIFRAESERLRAEGRAREERLYLTEVENGSLRRRERLMSTSPPPKKRNSKSALPAVLKEDTDFAKVQIHRDTDPIIGRHHWTVGVKAHPGGRLLV